jgi:hypothetical protein
VDTRTPVIIHLEHAIKQQDPVLETITTLEQQLQVLQLQVPPTESNAVSDVDEE